MLSRLSKTIRPAGSRLLSGGNCNGGKTTVIYGRPTPSTMAKDWGGESAVRSLAA
jgi:hypothetical protein